MFKYHSFLILLSFSLSSFTNQETGWTYSQSTQQAFYLFENLKINEELLIGDGCIGNTIDDCEGECCDADSCFMNPGTCDVIGAFYGDQCVGWGYAEVAPDIGISQFQTVAVMGTDTFEATLNYVPQGGLPRFVIYDASEEIEIDFSPNCQPENNLDSNGNPTTVDCSFNNLSFFMYYLGENGESYYTLDNDSVIPDGYEILNAYPNPFNPSISIDFFIDSYSSIDFLIYDILGNKIDQLSFGAMYVEGNHSISWEPGDIASGQYMISLLVNGDLSATKKVAYLK